METEAPLHRPACPIVLHTIAEKDLDMPVIHTHRQLDLHLAKRSLQDLADVRVEFDDIRRFVEEAVRVFVVIELFGHSVCLLMDSSAYPAIAETSRSAFARASRQSGVTGERQCCL